MKKSQEMTKHMEEIWARKNDPELKKIELLKYQREKRIKQKKQDLGI